MTNSMLGRAIESELELTVWDPPREFRYVARQQGRPEVDNRRVFVPLPGGTRLVGTTDARMRVGVTGLADQAVGHALQRTYDAATAKRPMRRPGTPGASDAGGGCDGS